MSDLVTVTETRTVIGKTIDFTNGVRINLSFSDQEAADAIAKLYNDLINENAALKRSLAWHLNDNEALREESQRRKRLIQEIGAALAKDGTDLFPIMQAIRLELDAAIDAAKEKP